MKKIVYVSVMCLLFLGIANWAFAMMCGSGGHKGEVIAQPASEETQDIGNKICPVGGEKIKEGKEIKVEQEGKTYNLCCKACVKDFKKNPQKYIEKLEAVEEKEHSEHQGHLDHQSEGHEGHHHK